LFTTTKHTPFTTPSRLKGHLCYSEKSYSYRFNGKELDKEGMGGGGSTYDYGFRIYNAQLGKFLSVDPLTKSYAFYAPYQFAGNKPIVALDLDGREDIWYQYIIQNDGSYLLVGTHESVTEIDRNNLELATGSCINPSGVISTVTEQDGTTRVVSYTPAPPPISPQMREKTWGEEMNDLFNSLYGSEKAQDNFIDGVDYTGKGIKYVGLAITPFALPAGIGVYSIGEGLTIGADFMKTSKHLEKGENSAAIIEVAGFIAGKIGGDASDKFLEEGRKKVVAEALFDQIIDKAKDHGKEKIQESKETQSNPK
jgi:RHS repeat-associated protein